MLTPRQRVHASIRRAGFDALPWQFDLTSVAAERLQRYYGVDDLREATGDHMLLFGDQPPESYQPDAAPPGCRRNEFGTVWGAAPADRSIGDWGGLVSYPLTEPSLAGYRFPDGAAPGRWRHAPEVRRNHPDLFLVAGGHGLWEQAWSLCGFENYLAYVAGETAFVEELTEHLADFSCAVTAQLRGLDVDGIRFGDDWGFQDRLMLRPQRWRRLFKKHYRRMFQAARDAGLVVMIHSCGNITEILPDLIEVGLQVVHPLQPEAMDVEHCRREFGRDLTFWGGLGSQSTLPRGTPDDCRREARGRLAQFRDGGYILAPAGAAPTDTPPENLAAIVEVARQQLEDTLCSR